MSSTDPSVCPLFVQRVSVKDNRSNVDQDTAMVDGSSPSLRDPLTVNLRLHQNQTSDVWDEQSVIPATLLTWCRDICSYHSTHWTGQTVASGYEFRASLSPRTSLRSLPMDLISSADPVAHIPNQTSAGDLQSINQSKIQWPVGNG
jgi:hypothetical protein